MGSSMNTAIWNLASLLTYLPARFTSWLPRTARPDWGFGNYCRIVAIAHFRPLPNEKHFGVEAAEIYWHFVDVVWIILFGPTPLSSLTGGAGRRLAPDPHSPTPAPLCSIRIMVIESMIIVLCSCSLPSNRVIVTWW